MSGKQGAAQGTKYVFSGVSEHKERNIAGRPFRQIFRTPSSLIVGARFCLPLPAIAI